MHLDRSGKAYRLAGKTLNSGSQRQMCARDLLRVPLARYPYHLDGGFTPLASMAVGLMASFLPVHLVVVLGGALSLTLAIDAFFAYSDVRRMAKGQACTLSLPLLLSVIGPGKGTPIGEVASP